MYSRAILLSANKWTSFNGAERNKNSLIWAEKAGVVSEEQGEAAQLIVLSESQVQAKLKSNGDHIPNMTRGLFHRGAKSVLSSLWPLPSTSNDVLLPNFFKQLKKGRSKTAALQLSSQSYLKKSATEAAAPSQWAAYTLIGNADAVTERNWYWLLLGIIPILSIWFLLRKRRRDRIRKEREVTTTMEY